MKRMTFVHYKEDNARSAYNHCYPVAKSDFLETYHVLLYRQCQKTNDSKRYKL